MENKLDLKLAFLLICHSWQELGQHQGGTIHPIGPKQLKALEDELKAVQDATKAFLAALDK